MAENENTARAWDVLITETRNVAIRNKAMADNMSATMLRLVKVIEEQRAEARARTAEIVRLRCKIDKLLKRN